MLLLSARPLHPLTHRPSPLSGRNLRSNTPSRRFNTTTSQKGNSLDSGNSGSLREGVRDADGRFTANLKHFGRLLRVFAGESEITQSELTE